MKNKSIKTKFIIAIIGIILALIAVYIGFLGSTTVQIALGKDYPFERDYMIYKNYANSYLRTWDKSQALKESMGVVDIESDIDEDSINITVNGEVCKLIAEYPIKFVDSSNEYKDTTISYDEVLKGEVKYQKISNVPSTFEALLIPIAAFALFAAGFTVLIDLIHDFINWIIAKVKKKKYKNIEN